MNARKLIYNSLSGFFWPFERLKYNFYLAVCFFRSQFLLKNPAYVYVNTMKITFSFATVAFMTAVIVIIKQ